MMKRNYLAVKLPTHDFHRRILFNNFSSLSLARLSCEIFLQIENWNNSKSMKLSFHVSLHVSQLYNYTLVHICVEFLN